MRTPGRGQSLAGTLVNTQFSLKKCNKWVSSKAVSIQKKVPKVLTNSHIVFWLILWKIWPPNDHYAQILPLSTIWSFTSNIHFCCPEEVLSLLYIGQNDDVKLIENKKVSWHTQTKMFVSHKEDCSTSDLLSISVPNPILQYLFPVASTFSAQTRLLRVPSDFAPLQRGHLQLQRGQGAIGEEPRRPTGRRVLGHRRLLVHRCSDRWVGSFRRKAEDWPAFKPSTLSTFKFSPLFLGYLPFSDTMELNGKIWTPHFALSFWPRD